MKLFLVAYDLIYPGQNYQVVANRLHSMGAKKVLESTWIVRGNYTAKTLRELVGSFMDTNDRVFVSETVDWSSFNALFNVNNI